MFDYQLIQLFRPIIQAGLTANGLSDVIVKEAFQPTQQGTNSGPTVYFFKLMDHRYGWPFRQDVWDENDSRMVHTEIQYYETMFQINAYIIQKPNFTNQLTASDLVNIVAQIMQTSTTIQTLENAGVGIYRVTDIQNPYFTDDKDRFEASPSFTFTLTHKQTSVTYSPVVESTQLDIFRI